MELILRITERRQPSHLIHNSVGVNPSVDGYLSTFPGVGGLRATKAGEVLEVEGGALWWQRPQRSPERKQNIKKELYGRTGLYGHMFISTKINGKKTRHHIDPPFSRLISIFKTNYCITWRGVKGYLQPGVPRTSNIWISSSHFVEHNVIGHGPSSSPAADRAARRCGPPA